MSTTNGNGTASQANINLLKNPFGSGTSGGYGTGVTGASGLPTDWYAQRYSGTIAGTSSIVTMEQFDIQMTHCRHY